MIHPDPILRSRRRFLRQTGALAVGAATFPAWFRAVPAVASASPYVAWEQTAKGDLTDLEYVALCGTLAANAHNTQPWAFNLLGNRIVLYADLARHLGQADPRRRLMLMGLGRATENMVVAAAQLGYAATVSDAEADAFPQNGGRCASLELARRSDSNTHPWFPAIFRRQTTRAEFEPLPISRNEFTESHRSDHRRCRGRVRGERCGVPRFNVVVPPFQTGMGSEPRRDFHLHQRCPLARVGVGGVPGQPRGFGVVRVPPRRDRCSEAARRSHAAVERGLERAGYAGRLVSGRTADRADLPGGRRAGTCSSSFGVPHRIARRVARFGEIPRSSFRGGAAHAVARRPGSTFGAFRAPVTSIGTSLINDLKSRRCHAR